MAKGNFIEYVVSDNPNKYPNDGEQGNYYYELYGGPKTVTLISFTIVGTSYQAEEGMTWKEWVESEYSPDSYYVSNGNVYTGETVKGDYPIYVVTRPEDEIIENEEYSVSY